MLIRVRLLFKNDHHHHPPKNEETNEKTTIFSLIRMQCDICIAQKINTNIKFDTQQFKTEFSETKLRREKQNEEKTTTEKKKKKITTPMQIDLFKERAMMNVNNF